MVYGEKKIYSRVAVSGEAPQVPVASRKSGLSFAHRLVEFFSDNTGHVFEKRLIEAYIAENGKDPITSEETTTDDLVELRTARIVKPRPPTLTSIPSLLSAFQNEWDALALETFNLRQHLTQTRQELSTALYQHDAAVRVIARLSKERDEAREALSKITLNGGTETNGEAMQVDGPELSSALVAKVEATQEKYVACQYIDYLLRGHLIISSDYRKLEENVLYRTTGSPLKLCKCFSL